MENGADISGEGIGRRLCITWFKMRTNYIFDIVKPECCCVNKNTLSICLSKYIEVLKCIAKRLAE